MIIDWFNGQGKELTGRRVVDVLKQPSKQPLRIDRQQGQVLVGLMKSWLADQRLAPRGERGQA